MTGAALASALQVLARTPWQRALPLAVLAFFERSAGSVQQDPYVSVFVINAVFTGFAAWNTTRLPDLPPHLRAEGQPRLAVLRDWPTRAEHHPGRRDVAV